MSKRKRTLREAALKEIDRYTYDLERVRVGAARVCLERRISVDPKTIIALLDCVEALDGVDGFFRSGNDVPVERAVIRTEQKQVQKMKAALAALDKEDGK